MDKVAIFTSAAAIIAVMIFVITMVLANKK